MNPDPVPTVAPCASTSFNAERVVPTGSLALDRALGTGGWPRGRIVEIYGPESSGKTTLVLEAIAQAQRSGTGALIDADHATDADTVKRLGVDPHGLVLHRGNVLEEIVSQVDQFIKRGIDVIAVDSLASVLLSGDSNSRHFPPVKNEEHQRALEHWMKALLKPLANSRSALLLTNQLREKVGVMYGDPSMTPWETHPLKDFASVRVEVKRVTHIKDGERCVGYECRMRVTKNRCAAPHRTAEAEIYYDRGIGIEGELITLGLEADVLTQSGQHLRFGEVILGRNRAAALRQLRRDEALAEQVRQAVVAAFDPVPVPPADPEECDGAG